MEQLYNFDSILSDIESLIKQLKKENSELKNRHSNSEELEQLKRENVSLKAENSKYQNQLKDLLERLNQIQTASKELASEDSGENVSPISASSHQKETEPIDKSLEANQEAQPQTANNQGDSQADESPGADKAVNPTSPPEVSNSPEVSISEDSDQTKKEEETLDDLFRDDADDEALNPSPQEDDTPSETAKENSPAGLDEAGNNPEPEEDEDPFGNDEDPFTDDDDDLEDDDSDFFKNVISKDKE